MKRLIAGIGCVGLLAILVVLFGFIQTGAYEEAVRGGTPSIEFFGRMLSRRYYRYTLISGLIAILFAGIDIFSLTTRVETIHSHEPQPKDHPLEFLAVRARRYFLVISTIAYIFMVIRMTGNVGFPVTQGGVIIFVVFFGLARRPMNKTILHLVKSVQPAAIDTLDSFLESREVTRQRDQEGRRR